MDIHKNYRLCEGHFEENYFSKGNTKKTLLPNAKPTLFLRICSSKSQSSKIITLDGKHVKLFISLTQEMYACNFVA